MNLVDTLESIRLRREFKRDQERRAIEAQERIAEALEKLAASSSESLQSWKLQ